MKHLLINITKKEHIHVDILSHFVKAKARKWSGYACAKLEVYTFPIIFRFMSIQHKKLDFLVRLELLLL